MAKIKLVGIKKFAEKKGIGRTTVWRQLKKDKLDYYAIPGSRRKWLRVKEANFREKERKMLEQILNYDSV